MSRIMFLTTALHTQEPRLLSGRSLGSAQAHTLPPPGRLPERPRHPGLEFHRAVTRGASLPEPRLRRSSWNAAWDSVSGEVSPLIPAQSERPLSSTLRAASVGKDAVHTAPNSCGEPRVTPRRASLRTRVLLLGPSRRGTRVPAAPRGQPRYASHPELSSCWSPCRAALCRSPRRSPHRSPGGTEKCGSSTRQPQGFTPTPAAKRISEEPLGRGVGALPPRFPFRGFLEFLCY